MAAKPAGRATSVLGLTGPIACGKSTAGTILLELGALVRIDADRVVHQLMSPGTITTRMISEHFGVTILAADGSVDRSRLAKLVFADEPSLRHLESIVHPAVRAAVRRELAAYSDRPGIAIIDAVRLLQSDLLTLCGEVWVITCDRTIELSRLRNERKMSREAAEARLAAQPVFSHPGVSNIIENNGSITDLRRQLADAWRRISSP